MEVRRRLWFAWLPDCLEGRHAGRPRLPYMLSHAAFHRALVGFGLEREIVFEWC